MLAGKPTKAPKKRPEKNRRLNALEIAEKESPDEIKIRSHRLGQVDDDPDESQNRADSDQRSTKRRRLSATNEDESAEEGSDLEGNRWHVGVEDEEEDSDIDSEEAFGESDEEKFADFTFRGSSSAQVSRRSKSHRAAADVGLDEESPDEQEDPLDDEADDGPDDDFGDDAIDLATAWDMDDQEEEQPSRKRRRPSESVESDVDGDDDVLSESREEDGSEADDDSESQLSISDDEGDHSRLQNFVDQLAGEQTDKSRQRRKDPKSLSDKPSQFGLSSSKISAADLMQYIKDPRQRQSLKVLQNSEATGYESYRGGVPGKLAPPLAKRQQDRLDRTAAYEESKKDLSKWIETVKQNRRAEHLSFPLVDQATTAAMSGKQLGPTSQSSPMTQLESTIQNIMTESGMLSKDNPSPEDQEQAFEELQEKQMPLEEVQARRAELRRARELMFREEIRARRIKKIKSKAYRRVHRKEREKAELERRSLLAAQGLIDSEEEQERNDRRRAEERMGARHRESKWAKSVKATGRAAWDDDARDGVTDLARRDEELRRRIEGKKASLSDAADSDSSDSDDLSGDDDENQRLKTKLDGLDTDEAETTETRLSSMAFMKRAEAARKAANDEEVRSIRRSLRGPDQAPIDQASSEDESPAGRQKFGQGGVEAKAEPKTEAQVRLQKSEFEERESEDGGEEETGIRFDDKEPSVAIPKSHVSTAQQSGHGGRATVNKSVTLYHVAPKSKPQTNGANGKTTETRPGVSAQLRKKDSRPSQINLDDYTSPSESEGEQDSRSALAQAIFAGGDDVEQDFAREKKETVKEEGDQIVDTGLPGWGSWAGEGVSKKAQKRAKGRFMTTIKGVSEDKRQDAKLERVIINEKKVKKNSKYLASELPHPFESRQQYERSLRLPLGPEWTTKSTFQDGTKPRVLLKQGIIRPMERPLV